jgi:peptide/nickel transport system permease protein
VTRGRGAAHGAHDADGSNDAVTRRRWSAGAAVAVGILGVVAVAAVAAPWLAPHDPAAQLDLVRLKNAPPSGAHPLGTDPFSRDLLSRALFGARTSLIIGLLGAALSTAVATAWGMIAGWLPETPADGMMGLVDALRAIPRKIVLLAALLFFPHPSALTLAILLGVTSWTTMSRVVFVQVRSLRARQFVTAAHALGASPARILARHVAPHLAGTIGAASALLVADMLAVEAALSFLGLGVRPPDASWGSILQDGVPYLASAWWIAATPCVLLVVTVLSVARLADAAGPPGQRVD